MLPGFPNLSLIYLISLDTVRYSSLLGIFCICVAYGPLPSSSRTLARLVRCLMLKESAWYLATFLPDYDDWIPVVISFSLMLGVTCGN